MIFKICKFEDFLEAYNLDICLGYLQEKSIFDIYLAYLFSLNENM